MKKTFLAAALVSIITLLASFIQQETPAYKNLQVLPKNITKQEMDSMMRHFSLSLGVRCGFCHVRNEETKKMDFASDKMDHKVAAREMFKMTRSINQKYFGLDSTSYKLGMVSCYTCHGGHVNPQAVPPPPPPVPEGIFPTPPVVPGH